MVDVGENSALGVLSAFLVCMPSSLPVVNTHWIVNTHCFIGILNLLKY